MLYLKYRVNHHHQILSLVIQTGMNPLRIIVSLYIEAHKSEGIPVNKTHKRVTAHLCPLPLTTYKTQGDMPLTEGRGYWHTLRVPVRDYWHTPPDIELTKARVCANCSFLSLAHTLIDLRNLEVKKDTKISYKSE